VYQQTDLLRLQQILTLKALGFSLEMIRDVLTDEAYNLQRALELQKNALAQRIGQLQVAHYALSQMQDHLHVSGSVDWEQVMTIIQSFAELNPDDLVNRYYTPEQQAWVQQRAVYTSPEMITEGARAWREVADGFAARRHLPPSHPELQALVARMEELVTLFTGGDPGITAAHTQHTRENEHRMPAAFRMTTDETLGDFIRQAVEIYQANKERKS
jgi:MerR family transcriptional regulator, thiopeptide resistance regulator